MVILRFARKLISPVVFILILVLVIMNFNTIFDKLNYNALAISDNSQIDQINIPSNLNFISDDKALFIEYCKSLYGEDLPLNVDEDNYIYYGANNGYRFYRLQAAGVPFEPAWQSETVGGHVFESSCLYRPALTGLYIIGNDKVYTLSEAYDQKLIDIGVIYNLYQQKTNNNNF